MESLRCSKQIKLIVTRHEQAAAMMAATVGRLTGPHPANIPFLEGLWLPPPDPLILSQRCSALRECSAVAGASPDRAVALLTLQPAAA